MSKTHRSFRTLGFTIVILAFASLAITASTSSGFAFLSEVSEMFGSAMPTAKGSRAVRSVAAPEATNIVVNYDFASAVTGTPCAASPLTTAAGVSSTFTTGGTGGGTCTTPGGIAASTGGTPPAFVSNAENQSVSLTSFAPGSSNFFQFQLSGVGNYSDYMLFFQSQRSGTGPLNADVQYSTNGTDFTTFQTVNLAAAFSGFNLDLSTVSAIEGQPTVYIRIRGSGGTGASGTFRVDNF